MRRRLASLLSASMLGACAMSGGSGDGSLLMQASWGEVRMQSNGSGTLVWVPFQGGRTLRLPWMRSASRVDVRDGNDKASVVALVRLSSKECSNRSAVVIFDTVGAAAEMVGECGAPVRLSEAEGSLVVVDDSTLAVMRVSGTELVSMRAPLKKATPAAVPAPPRPSLQQQAPKPPVVPPPSPPAGSPAAVPAQPSGASAVPANQAAPSRPAEAKPPATQAGAGGAGNVPAVPPASPAPPSNWTAPSGQPLPGPTPRVLPAPDAPVAAPPPGAVQGRR